MIIQSLWIGKKISRMEIACMRSFVSLGYKYHLYTYDHIDNVPDEIKICDGNLIVNKKEIFTYNLPNEQGGNSVSAFSNLFRYKLLYEKGGWWVDTDVYLLKKLPNYDYVLVQEDKNKIASCILKFPPKNKFNQMCYDVCVNKNSKDLVWGETGPLLVTEISKKLKLNTLESHNFLPIKHHDVNYFMENIDIPCSYTVHFWNEKWRRLNLCKNKIYSNKTLYEKIISKNTISLL